MPTLLQLPKLYSVKLIVNNLMETKLNEVSVDYITLLPSFAAEWLG
jgi:hypothetical protein